MKIVAASVVAILIKIKVLGYTAVTTYSQYHPPAHSYAIY